MRGLDLEVASARGASAGQEPAHNGPRGLLTAPPARLGRRYDRLTALYSGNYGLAREISRAGASRSAMLKRYAAVDPGSLATSGFKSLSRNNHATPSEDFGFWPVTRFPSMRT
jgi:hypothetical protein